MTTATTFRQTEHGLLEGDPPAQPLSEWLIAQLPPAGAAHASGDTPSTSDEPAGVRETATRWLLAHTTEGVIWGIVQGGQLVLSSDAGAFPVPGLSLDWALLLQLRLFDATSELFVWRGPALDPAGAPMGERWQWRRYTDGGGPAGERVEYLSERYLLWGNRPLARGSAFIQVVEGQQGIVHAPPIGKAPDERRRAALAVRHYLERSGTTGAVAVGDTRLVALVEPGP